MASGHWRQYRPRYFYSYQWPHLTSLYSSTSRLENGNDNRNGKHSNAIIGYDNVFDAAEPYGAYKFYLAPREEFVIGSDPTLYHRQFKSDDDDRTSGYTNSYKDENNCRVFLCAFLILSFIGVIVAAVTLGVLLSYHRHIPDPTTTTTAPPGQIDNYQHKLVLRNRTYTSDLSDPTSQAFNDTATEFCSRIDAIYTAADSPIKDIYVKCQVIKFTNGSIGVQYRIIVRKTSQTPQVKLEDLRTHLINTVGKSGIWSDYDIDPIITIFVEESTITTQSASDISTTDQTSTTTANIVPIDKTTSSSTTTGSSPTTSGNATTQETSTSDISISPDGSSTITITSTSTDKTLGLTSVVVDSTTIVSPVTSSFVYFSTMIPGGSDITIVDRTSAAPSTDFTPTDALTTPVPSLPAVTDTSVSDTLSSSLVSAIFTDTTSIATSSATFLDFSNVLISTSLGMTDSITIEVSSSSQYVDLPTVSGSAAASFGVTDSLSIAALLPSQYVDSLLASGSSSTSIEEMASSSSSTSIAGTNSMSIAASSSSQFVYSPTVTGSTSASSEVTDSLSIAASSLSQYVDLQTVSSSSSTSIAGTNSMSIAASSSSQFVYSPTVTGSTSASSEVTDSLSIAASSLSQYVDLQTVSSSSSASIGVTGSMIIAISSSSQYMDLPTVSGSASALFGVTDSLSIAASLPSQYVDSLLASGSPSTSIAEMASSSSSTSIAGTNSMSIAASSSSQFVDSPTVLLTSLGITDSFLSPSTSFLIIDSSTAYLSSSVPPSDNSSVAVSTYLDSTSIIASVSSIYNDSTTASASMMHSLTVSKSPTQFESSSISTFSSSKFADPLISSASVSDSMIIVASLKSEYSDTLTSSISSSPAVFHSPTFSTAPSFVYSSTAPLPLPSTLNDINLSTISASLYSKAKDYSSVAAYSTAFIDKSTISGLSFSAGVDATTIDSSSFGSMTPTFDSTMSISSSTHTLASMAKQPSTVSSLSSGVVTTTLLSYSKVSQYSLTVTPPISYSSLGSTILVVSSSGKPESTSSINAISTNIIGDSTTTVGSKSSFTNTMSFSFIDSPNISESYGTTLLSTSMFHSSSEYASETSSNVIASRLGSLDKSSVTLSGVFGTASVSSVQSSVQNLMTSNLKSSSISHTTVSTSTISGVLILDSTPSTIDTVSVSSIVPSIYTSIISSLPVTSENIQSTTIKSSLSGSSLSTSIDYPSLPISFSFESTISSSVFNSSNSYTSTPFVTPSLSESASMQATLTVSDTKHISADMSVTIVTTPIEYSITSEYTGSYSDLSVITSSIDTPEDVLSPTITSVTVTPGVEQTFQTTTMLDNVATAGLPEISASSSVSDLAKITTIPNSHLLMSSLSTSSVSLHLASSFSAYANNFVSSSTPGASLSIASSNSPLAMESNLVSSSITN